MLIVRGNLMYMEVLMLEILILWDNSYLFFYFIVVCLLSYKEIKVIMIEYILSLLVWFD